MQRIIQVRTTKSVLTYCPGPKDCRDKWPVTNACFIDVHVLYLHHGYASNNHGAHTAYGTIQVACIAGTKTIMFAVQKPLYRSIDRQMDVATTRLLNLYLVKLAWLHAKYQPQATTDAILDQLTASNSRNHVVYSLLPKW